MRGTNMKVLLAVFLTMAIVGALAERFPHSRPMIGISLPHSRYVNGNCPKPPPDIIPEEICITDNDCPFYLKCCPVMNGKWTCLFPE